jgi:curved DNA-binding protein CbpA
MTTTTADYYTLLGVDPGATTAQIKSAYRKLAKQYHPDVNTSSDAAERFREITEAYDTLTDPDRRRRYDRLHGTNRTTFTDDDQSRYTRPGTGSANGSRFQAASPILKVLEDVWLEIRRWHPDIPPAVIIIASGTDGKHPRWGHHAPGRWNVNGQQYAEVMISGEGLRRTPDEVLGTLLHEAAHALAHSRGIKDTSRQGRYHNKHFKTHAKQLGLAAGHDQRNGWAVTTITDVTRIAYARQLHDLAQAMTLWRHGETTTGPATRRNSNFIAAACPCGRSIRVAASTLAEAPITCAACGQDFQAKNPDGA